MQAIPEFSAHAWGDVAVDATHSGHLVTHSFGLEDVANTKVIEPGLMTVTQPVRAQPGSQRQPARESGVVAGLSSRPGAVLAVELVADERPILPKLDSAVAGRAPPATVLTSDPGYPTSHGRRVRLAGNRGWPR